MVHLSGSFQLAEKFEQIGHLIFTDAFARVNDVSLEHLSVFIVAHVDSDGTLLREFQAVLDQVDQDLL